MLTNKIIEEADWHFLQVIKTSRTYVPEFYQFDKKAKTFKDFIAKHRTQRFKAINYDKDSLVFNRTYFMKNLYKAIISLVYIRNKLGFSSNCVLYDIGAGAGVFTLALKSVIKKDFKEIRLIERNARQMSYARKIVKAKEAKFIQESFPTDYYFLDAGICLYSYWACEQDYKALSNPISKENLADYLLKHDSIFIDYPENIDFIYKRIPDSYDTVKWNFRFPVSEEIKNLLKESQIKVNGIAYFQPKNR